MRPRAATKTEVIQKMHDGWSLIQNNLFGVTIYLLRGMERHRVNFGSFDALRRSGAIKRGEAVDWHTTRWELNDPTPTPEVQE